MITIFTQKNILLKKRQMPNIWLIVFIVVIIVIFVIMTTVFCNYYIVFNVNIEFNFLNK